MSQAETSVERDRQALIDAQRDGSSAIFKTYFRLSGPGWLQSAITLGSGSLAGALFLGVLGGTSLLWLQLVAIVMGVIMLSAISYVTLSTGERPFRAINKHINPVLGWGWLIATCMANMIWCMPQFSVSFAALQKNLFPNTVGDTLGVKIALSVILFSAALVVVLLNGRRGAAAKVFDGLLKALVGMIVLCFFGVVVYLSLDGRLDWGQIFAGFVPDLRQWNQPTGQVTALLQGLPENLQSFWSERLVKEQRAVMIGAAATAVGINMTFLLPYSMLNRGWSKPFRGLARFDLATGMAIPYVLVTSCVVIASAATFHAKVDPALMSTDPVEMQQSPLYAGASKVLVQRLEYQQGAEPFAALGENEQLGAIAALPDSEKRLAASLVRRNAFELSQALAPLLGPKMANLIFGIGVLAMGFSTIVILMLINGYAFCELVGAPQGGKAHLVGCIVAGLAGASWPLLWDGPAKLWLAILTSSFGMMLLPIAYFTFLMMMNSKSLLGDEKPQGGKMLLWNILMIISVLGALVAAGTAIWDKASHPTAGPLVMAVGVLYLALVVIGFIVKAQRKTT
ncbi:MAG: divalent metal cation transporter [Pirellulales bacterium]|nr:divalent metal cation transporter [Pirellulales bacterium]